MVTAGGLKSTFWKMKTWINRPAWGRTKAGRGADKIPRPFVSAYRLCLQHPSPESSWLTNLDSAFTRRSRVRTKKDQSSITNTASVRQQTEKKARIRLPGTGRLSGPDSRYP